MNEPRKHGLEQPKGHGFLFEGYSKKDYLAGVNSRLKGTTLIESGDWRSFLPIAEHQAPSFETNGCTHFATLNAIETNFKFLFGKELNLSDRLTLARAKQLGILDPARGGTPGAAIDYIRKNWSVREDEYPTASATNVGEFYTPPSETLLQLAMSRKEEVGYIVNYEYIPNPTIARIKDSLKKGTVCFSNALMPDSSGIYYRPEGWSDTHWAQAVYVDNSGQLYMRDQYPPFDKIIREDFVPGVAIRYQLNPELAWSLLDLITSLKNLLKKYGIPA